MEWKESFSTGIKKIDDEHRELVRMIDRLEKAMERGEAEDILGPVLKNLVEYVRFHFRNEEEVMVKTGFPDLKRHRVLHRNLVNEVASILNDLKKDRLWTVPELVGFLQHWLVDHILGEDVRIGQHLGVV